jgi:hypothetical protein
MKLVLIEWEDSIGCGTDWTPLPKRQEKPPVARSVGWLVRSDARAVTLVPHIVIGQGCGDMVIPTTRTATAIATSATVRAAVPTAENPRTNHMPNRDWLRRVPQVSSNLPGGYRCEMCRATGQYPVDSTTPKNAFRILFESCPDCDPHGEDAYGYIDLSGNPLSILPDKRPDKNLQK